jgi:hypothetical protein
MNEIWIELQNYEGIYWVSSFGNVRNAAGKYLSSQITNSGYCLVHLYKQGLRKACTTHRLVATHFNPNPENKKQVNHKDLIKTNNNSSNLEWCDAKENMRHLFNSDRMNEARAKAKIRMVEIGRKYGKANIEKTRNINRINVSQYDLQGNLIAEFGSLREVQKITGFERKTISLAIKAGRTFKKKYIFKIKTK